MSSIYHYVIQMLLDDSILTFAMPGQCFNYSFTTSIQYGWAVKVS